MAPLASKLSFKKMLIDEQLSFWVKTDFLGCSAKVSTSRMESIEKDLANIFE